jgi:hypothetical protein
MTRRRFPFAYVIQYSWTAGCNNIFHQKIKTRLDHVGGCAVQCSQVTVSHGWSWVRRPAPVLGIPVELHAWMHFELWFLVDLTSELLRFGLLVIANFPIIGAIVLFLV